MKHYIRTLLFTFLYCFNNLLIAQTAEVVLTVGHTDQINCIAFSQDGKFIVSGGNDKISKIWDVRTTKEIRTLAGNDGRIVACQFDPTSNYVAILDYSGNIKVWDIRSGKVTSTFFCDVAIEYVDFCMNGKYVLFQDKESNLCLGDFLTGSIYKKIKLKHSAQRLIVSQESNYAYYYDYQSNLTEINLETGEERRSIKLFQEYVYLPTRFAIDKKGTRLAMSLNSNNILLFDLINWKKETELKSHTTRIKDICFDTKSKNLYSADHNNVLLLWDTDSKKINNRYDKTVYGINYICAHPTENVIAFTESKMIHYVDPKSMKVLKQFSAKGNRIISMSYDQKDRYLATATDNLSIKLWNLQALKIEKQLFGFFPVEFSPDGGTLACMGTPSSLFIYNPVSGEKIKELTTDNELIQNLNFSADNRYLAGAGFYGILKIWDLESGKLIQQLKGHNGGIYSSSFSPDGKLIASCGLDNEIIIWDTKSGKEVKRISGEHQIITHDLEFSPDGSKLAVASWDKTISIWNTKDWTLHQRLIGHVNSIYTLNFSPDSKYLASGAGNNSVSEADNSIRVWEVQSGTTVCHFKNPEGAINKVIFDKNGEILYSASDDGIAKIWDLKNCKQVAGLISVNVNDYIIETPDYFYTASKNALQAVSFRIENKLFPFEQFDIRLNRPDIVAARIGKTPINLAKAFHYVYEKRMKRMNFKKEDLNDDFHLPEIEINRKEIPFVTQSSQLKFTVRMRDSKYKLDRIIVRINEVPIFGPLGYSLSNIAKNDIQQEITIDLINGNNKLMVSCINEKGVESLIEEFAIIREGVAGKSNLYAVGIGVSDYQDQRFNLKYAAKDAQDMLTRFNQSSGLFQKINTKLLLNSEVTIENILALQNFLNQSGPEDVVVIFIAGHGVLDANYEYYFGTHDIDFEHPELRGISYESIEKLFTFLKAQRKLLIMDTCHSGELDKEEVEQNKLPQAEIKDVTFRSVGEAIKTKEAFGVSNTLELMQLLFTDVKSGTGTVVISSAGGAEFAMESESWKNGLFTYCLLSASQDFKADLNFDKRLSISELRAYTYTKVLELSKGRQKPNTRAENLSLDFFLW